MITFNLFFQVVEDGYEFFAKRQLVTLFSAPNYCGEFDNAGAMMSVDETLMCSFQVRKMSELQEEDADFKKTKQIKAVLLNMNKTKTTFLLPFNFSDSQTCRQETVLWYRRRYGLWSSSHSSKES